MDTHDQGGYFDLSHRAVPKDSVAVIGDAPKPASILTARPDVQFVEFDGLGHYPMPEDPKRLRKALGVLQDGLTRTIRSSNDLSARHPSGTL